MLGKLKNMSIQFKDGYFAGIALANNYLSAHGPESLIDGCYNTILAYRKDGKSEDYIYGMQYAISIVSRQVSRKIYGPRENIKKINR